MMSHRFCVLLQLIMRLLSPAAGMLLLARPGALPQRSALPQALESSDADIFAHVPLKRLTAAFEQQAAQSGSEELGAQEFARAVRASGAAVPDRAVANAFAAADVDGSGSISIDEFLAPRAVSELLP